MRELLFSLLADEANKGGSKVMTYVLLGVLVVAIIAMFFMSGRRNKSENKEYVESIAAIKPGNKVKTAGGLCGVVVEVNDEDNTFVIETGSEGAGKSYFKIVKESIYQTDAKGPTQIAREAAEAARKAEKEAKAAAKTAPAPTPTPEEAPSEEPVAESAPEEAEAPVEEKPEDTTSEN